MAGNIDSRVQRLVKYSKIVAIFCNQWGDSGKGKVVNLLAKYWAEVIARGTGGPNAGHTTVIKGKERIYHLLPTGIENDPNGKINLLGNGMVLDLKVLIGEIDDAAKEGIECNNLMISEDAFVILPYHVDVDRARNVDMTKGGVGSTGRGIGPSYTDKVMRKGVMVRDLYNLDVLKRKTREALQRVFPDKTDINKTADEIIDKLKPYADRIKQYIRNTIAEMHQFARDGKKILLEGAQGLLLSIEFGTYPYVTSSDCSLNGLASGVGLSAKAVDLPLGIVKFPYMTRVGAGPFPTEFGGKKSEEYCAKGLEHDVHFELDEHKIPYTEKEGVVKYDHHHPNIVALMNSEDPFLQGVGVRLAGGEFGATTKRPRRCGWTDLVALKYAIGINGPNIILSKVDVLQGAEKIRLAINYGRAASFRDSDALRKVVPNYSDFQGFKHNIAEETIYDNLPSELRLSMRLMEMLGANILAVSTGPEREQIIVR